MKKPRIPLLAVLTLVFAVFILGIFTGRNTVRDPVRVRPLSPAATSAPSETAAAETGSAATAAPETEPPGPVNINTATPEQLQTLPGIGPVLAQRIVDYRSENGSFQSVGELTNVSGIGEKTLEALWDLVTIGG